MHEPKNQLAKNNRGNKDILSISGYRIHRIALSHGVITILPRFVDRNVPSLPSRIGLIIAHRGPGNRLSILDTLILLVSILDTTGRGESGADSEFRKNVAVKNKPSTDD